MSLRIVLSGACGSYSGKVLEFPFGGTVAAAHDETEAPPELVARTTVAQLVEGIRRRWPAKELPDVDFAERDVTVLHNGRRLAPETPLREALPTLFPGGAAPAGGASPGPETPPVHLVFRPKAAAAAPATDGKKAQAKAPKDDGCCAVM